MVDPHFKPPLVIEVNSLEFMKVPVVCGPLLNMCRFIDAALIVEVALVLRASAAMLRMILDAVRVELPHMQMFIVIDLSLPIRLLIS